MGDIDRMKAEKWTQQAAQILKLLQAGKKARGHGGKIFTIEGRKYHWKDYARAKTVFDAGRQVKRMKREEALGVHDGIGI